MMLDHMRDPSPELAMAVLLHDVGKPQTQTFDERIRFDEHDRAGEVMSVDICRRLRLPNDVIEHVAALVGNHMRFMAVQRMRLSTLKRLLAMPKFEEPLELHRLDCVASHGKLDNYEFLSQKMTELSREEIQPPPLVTGYTLMDMGYKPGPVFGGVLDAVRDEQLEGRLTTAEEAIHWIQERYPLGGQKHD
jgi:putative nucleotidyltransferase with HDIG domain